MYVDQAGHSDVCDGGDIYIESYGTLVQHQHQISGQIRQPATTYFIYFKKKIAWESGRTRILKGNLRYLLAPSDFYKKKNRQGNPLHFNFWLKNLDDDPWALTDYYNYEIKRHQHLYLFNSHNVSYFTPCSSHLSIHPLFDNSN